MEIVDGAFHVVWPVLGFGGDGPRRLVAGADVETAEEDGVESVGCGGEDGWEVEGERIRRWTYSTSTP